MVQSVGRHLERNVEPEESVVRLQVVVLGLYVENTNNLESERVKWLVKVGKRGQGVLEIEVLVWRGSGV